MRSSTFVFQAFSRLRCWIGESCALTTITSGSSWRASAAISSTLPLPTSVAGTGRASGADVARDDSQPDRTRKPDGLGETGVCIGGQAWTGVPSARHGARKRCANARRSFWRSGCLDHGLGVHKLDRSHRHDGRDRVLVDELGLPVPPKQHAEIVEPSDVPLKLDAIDEEKSSLTICFFARR